MAAVDQETASISAGEIRAYSAVKKGFTPFRENDVLFAKITPCMENGKVALARGLKGGFGFGSTEFHVLRASARVLPEWLRYYVLRPSFRKQAKRRMSGAVGQQRVPAEFLSESLIPIPPVDEQRRIVELLSRAENIVRMRREAEAKAKEIIPTLFLDMFGDPRSNPKGWPIKRFRELVERVEGGKNVQAGAVGDSPFRILKISAVTSGSYDESESKPAPAGFDPPAHYFVRIGDVLFSRANTEALVGATAMVHSTDGQSLLPDKLWRLVWRPTEGIAPAYMLAMLQNRSVRQELSKMASGTGGSMKNISQAKLLELKLPIPPAPLQHVFQEYVSIARDLLGAAGRAGELADRAFQALLGGVFKERSSV